MTREEAPAALSPSPVAAVLRAVARSPELRDRAESVRRAAACMCGSKINHPSSRVRLGVCDCICGQAWQSWLGFYNSHLKLVRWDKAELVQQANAFAPALGLAQPPALQRKTIGMMGLKGVPGLRVDDSDHHGRG